MAAKSGKSDGAKGARILLVDDDERNLLALREVLAPIAKVVTATSGREALRMLMKEEFAVILLDVFMPDIDGYETASFIRNRPQTARVPIIFLSAVNKETEHLMKGYEMGAVDYVFKPVDPLVLKSKVAVFVDLYAIRQQVEQQARAEQELREANYREQLSRRDAERQLADSQRRQASILQILPMAVYETSISGEGSELRKFVGGDIAHFLGSDRNGDDAHIDWLKMVDPNDRSGAIERMKADLDSVSLEYRVTRPDGRILHVLDQRARMNDDGNNSWAGTLLDITDRKQLEAQLVHVGKLDALGQLTGGIAHDFNNLLAAMKGGLHVLANRLTMGPKEIQITEQMSHAVNQGAELVRRMMAFARQQDLNPTSIDPRSLCDTVAGLVKHALGGTVEVEWECREAEFNLYVDRGQLELALMNLIINGRDAMPEGGKIKVTVEPLAASQTPKIRIQVADQGCGIPKDQIDKVMEPFFTTKDVGKGTGLGLSMVAGFVHQSDGEITIDSVIGKGTKVEIILPATEAPAANSLVPELDALNWLDGKTMLLVDDDDVVRKLLAEQFRDAGCEVDEAQSGESAISKMRERPGGYDFILSDFAMPGMNGVDTVTRLRELATNGKFAIMTGFADEIDIKQGGIPVIHKPLSLDKLRDAFLQVAAPRDPE